MANKGLEVETEKPEKFPATKYFKKVGLVGLLCLSYVGIRHMFGAEQLDYQSTLNLKETADFFIGGFGILSCLGSAIYTPIFYLLEKSNS